MSKLVKPLSGEGRAVLEALNRHRGGMTDAEFFRKHIEPAGISSSVWSRLNRDIYTGDTPKKELALRGVLNTLEANAQAVAVLPNGARRFIETPRFTAICRAIETCAERLDKKRGVSFFAATGGGKTATCRQLMHRFERRRDVFPGGVVLVESTESCKTYKGSLENFARAVGIFQPWRGTDEAQASVLAACKERGRFLLINDECQYWSPHTVNFMKLIANQTQAVIFTGAEPFLWAEFEKKSWATASQWKNRQRAVFHLDELTSADVLPHIERFTASHEIAAEIARSATTFGLFDRVADVIFWMEKAGSDWTLPNVRAAIHKADQNAGLVK